MVEALKNIPVKQEDVAVKFCHEYNAHYCWNWFRLLQVCASKRKTFVLVDNGSVYGFGWMGFGSLGFLDRGASDKVLKPRILESLRSITYLKLALAYTTP
ncbi:hypothetical protein RDI58_000637 [Solanum bulbocastanum]|uniref:Uncharacterized protein n=1 Tax=Solanum bulbocastanum TaxID=147425 RepID=A0AAN8U6J3_SOLBU